MQKRLTTIDFIINKLITEKVIKIYDLKDNPIQEKLINKLIDIIIEARKYEKIEIENAFIYGEIKGIKKFNSNFYETGKYNYYQENFKKSIYEDIPPTTKYFKK